MGKCNIGILLAVISASIVLSDSVLATTILDTTSITPWKSVGSWGEGSSETVGQTFTVGNDNRLDSFIFFVLDAQNPDFIDFAAYVMEWNGMEIGRQDQFFFKADS